MADDNAYIQLWMIECQIVAISSWHYSFFIKTYFWLCSVLKRKTFHLVRNLKRGILWYDVYHIFISKCNQMVKLFTFLQYERSSAIKTNVTITKTQSPCIKYDGTEGDTVCVLDKWRVSWSIYGTRRWPKASSVTSKC